MSFQNAMYDRNFVSGDLVHGYISGVVFLLWRVGEEEEVPSVERWFHGSTAGEMSDLNGYRGR